jgi:hypothetical protein
VFSENRIRNMKQLHLRHIALIIISLAAWLPSTAGAQVDVVYDSIVADLRIRADGTVDVHEQLFAAYGDAAVGYAIHRLNGEYVSGIAGLRVTVGDLSCEADPSVRSVVLDAASTGDVLADTCGYTSWNDPRDIVIGYVFPAVYGRTLRHDLVFSAATGRTAFAGPTRLHWYLVYAANGIPVRFVRATVHFPEPPPRLEFAAGKSEFVTALDSHTVEITAANFGAEEWLRADFDAQSGVASIRRGSERAESWRSIAQAFALVAIVMLILWAVLKILGRRSGAESDHQQTEQ